MLIVRFLLVCAGWGALCLGALSQVVEGDPAVGGGEATEAGPEAATPKKTGNSSAKKKPAGAKAPKNDKGGGTPGDAGNELAPVSLVSWRVVAELPALPGQTAPGLAGVFAGALDATHALVAGGTFYEGKGPLEGGERTFSDRVLVLTQAPAAPGAAPAYSWKVPDLVLPRPLAYGASVTLDDGVLMIGGSDGTVCVPDVRLVTWDGTAQQPAVTDFPPLPKPLAYLGAGRVGAWVMVVGGTTTPDGRSGADVFGLDLSRRGEPEAFAWQTLPALPAAVHFPIVVGEQGDDGKFLHVFGGRDLRPGQDDRVLSDGWRFDPAAQTWTTSGAITPGGPGSPPVALMAGTAVALEERRLLVLGGDDGALARLLEENARRPGAIEERESYARLNAAILAAHPGHRRAQMLYDARLGRWRAAGHFPEATPAVTPAFLWDGAIMLIGGEPAPGRRSARVWLGALESE